eukprot:405552_1
MEMTKNNYSFDPLAANPTDPVVHIAKAHPILQETNENAGTEVRSASPVIVGCGLAGCIVGGPLLAVLTALGGAYAAEHDQGPIGESCRAVGRITMTAGKKAKEE